jgi:hypothetical protein
LIGKSSVLAPGFSYGRAAIGNYYRANRKCVANLCGTNRAGGPLYRMLSEHNNRCLGVSLAIYLIVVTFDLMMFVVPVLLANGPTKFDNPGIAAYDPPPGTLLISRARNLFPLAFLKHDDLFDPAMVAAPNARSKNAEKPHHLANRSVQRVRPEAPSENTRFVQPANSGCSFFSFLP